MASPNRINNLGLIMSTSSTIAVLGAGSWGTALAIQLARSGAAVKLWGRDTELVDAMVRDRVNERYLPDAPFPDTLQAEPDWDKAIADTDFILVSVPSHSFRQILNG